MKLVNATRYVCVAALFATAAAAQESLVAKWNRLTGDARAAVDAGRYEEAEKKYDESIRSLSSAGGQDFLLARSLYELAAVHEMTGRNTSAIRLLIQSIALLDTKPGPGSEDIAFALQGLGTAYLNVRSYAKAAESFQRALEYVSDTLTPQGVALHTGLANCYRAQGRYREAESVLLRVRSRLPAGGAPWIEVLLLTALGNLYIWQNRLPESEAVLKQGLEIADRFKPEEPGALAKRAAVSYLSYNLGVTHLKRKQYHEAEPLFARALEMSENGAPVPPADVARILTEYARCTRKLGNQPLAASLESRAKSLSVRVSAAEMLVDVTTLLPSVRKP